MRIHGIAAIITALEIFVLVKWLGLTQTQAG